MLNRLRNRWLNLTQSLGFVPFLVAGLFTLLGLVLVEVDKHVDLSKVKWVFTGDGSAARTVLSVIAGSLITVAGLTFSITMVVLQLASSQFSPRILRTFFGDRLTQITIGTYVGIFIYSILVLRAVGSLNQPDAVPRLSVTIAALLSIGAVLLLVTFLHHVSKLVQVSEVTARIARAGLTKIDELYPEDRKRENEVAARPSAPSPSVSAAAPGDRGNAGFITPARPGFVQRVSLDDLLEELAGHAMRAEVLICPGDFVSAEEPIIALWPADVAHDHREAVLGTVTVSSERDLDQDVGFALRQLTDIALKAMSPGINDPMTAVTAIGYLRSLLARLSGRGNLSAELTGKHGLTVVVRRRSYLEYLESSLLQIGRYAAGDAWVTGEILTALNSCARVAAQPFPERLTDIADIGSAIIQQSLDEVSTERDRASIRAAQVSLEQLCRSRSAR